MILRVAIFSSALLGAPPFVQKLTFIGFATILSWSHVCVTLMSLLSFIKGYIIYQETNGSSSSKLMCLPVHVVPCAKDRGNCSRSASDHYARFASTHARYAPRNHEHELTVAKNISLSLLPFYYRAIITYRKGPGIQS